jgi:hypothetical protein
MVCNIPNSKKYYQICPFQFLPKYTKIKIYIGRYANIPYVNPDCKQIGTIPLDAAARGQFLNGICAHGKNSRLAQDGCYAYSALAQSIYLAPFKKLL